MVKIETKRGTIIVDKEDFDRVSRFVWHISKTTGYVSCLFHENNSRKVRAMRLQRFIVDCKESEEVDHINGDKLDNRKCNLRVCTRQENSFNRKIPKNNTTGYKGVRYIKQGNRIKRWRATLEKNGKSVNGGTHITKEEAAKAYNKLALEHFGKFARLNAI